MLNRYVFIHMIVLLTLALMYKHAHPHTQTNCPLLPLTHQPITFDFIGPHKFDLQIVVNVPRKIGTRRHSLSRLSLRYILCFMLNTDVFPKKRY